MKLSSTKSDGEHIHVTPETRNLGVIMNSSLTMDTQVNNEDTKKLVQALVKSKLDYCIMCHSLAFLIGFC